MGIVTQGRDIKWDSALDSVSKAQDYQLLDMASKASKVQFQIPED